MLGSSFEPVGATALLRSMLGFIGKLLRYAEQSARSKFFKQANDTTDIYGTDGQLVGM